MEFSVVEIGYDQHQVDCCLEDLGERLARLAVRADAAARTTPELAQLRAEIARLGALLATRPATDGRSGAARQVLLTAEREAAEILARARADLAAAREEARRVRDQVYAEALQARRDLEAALVARRIRAERADEILRDVAGTGEPQLGAARTGEPPLGGGRADEPSLGADPTREPSLGANRRASVDDPVSASVA